MYNDESYTEEDILDGQADYTSEEKVNEGISYIEENRL